MSVRLQNLWNFGGRWSGLDGQFNEGYVTKLDEFLCSQRANGFYPAEGDIFKAFEATPLDEVKVVIVGQDPYTDGSATGLAFSIPKHREFPPSLRNIYRELESDLGHPVARCGDLTHWAAQGVLLLNSVLTVRVNHTFRSHRRGGWWTRFTNQALKLIDAEPRGVVFCLLGSARRGQEEAPCAQQLRSHADSVSSLAEDVWKAITRLPKLQRLRTLLAGQPSPRGAG